MRSAEEFHGRTAVVTGAAEGIGVASASAFAERGATLVLNDLHIPSGHEHLGAWRAGDLREPKVVDDLVGTAEEVGGRLDVLVNAAGIQLRKPAAQASSPR